ncbi:MAG: zf-HC2 domain-containing protein [Armatimonadota bacterium]
MKCPTLDELAEYQADVLPTAAAERVRQHVAGCEPCRRELAALAEAGQLVAALPTPVTPDNLWAGVAARLPVHPHRSPLSWWWKTAAGFGLAAALFAGLTFSRSHQGTLPMASSEAVTYVTDHQLLSARDPLADRAGLGVMLAAQETVHPR